MRLVDDDDDDDDGVFVRRSSDGFFSSRNIPIRKVRRVEWKIEGKHPAGYTSLAWKCLLLEMQSREKAYKYGLYSSISIALHFVFVN